jgi:DHA1 family inner membrane transport protein
MHPHPADSTTMVYRTDSTLMIILAVTVFFVGATEFMLSSMLTPLAEAFHTSSVGSAWLISSYACSYALAAPVFGYFSDRVDRSKVLLVALVLFAMDNLAIVFAPTLALALILRVFGGMASAALIPTVFAMISDVVPPARQASAMGIVMLGMTAGIAVGPAFAGMLTDLVGWRTPFLLMAAGCIAVFAAGLVKFPHRPPVKRSSGKGLAWFRRWPILRPLIAKGAWNGTGVAAFLLSGEVLRQRYGFGTGEVGLTVTAFGLGLGIGNMSAGLLRYLCRREEISLLVVITLLVSSISIFMLVPLPLTGALACLAVWGAALGAGAPSSTVILAARAKHDKGMVLAFAETFNNVSILCAVPLAMSYLIDGGTGGAMTVLAAGLSAGLILSVIDVIATHRLGGLDR